jgi:hypothetical protein
VGIGKIIIELRSHDQGSPPDSKSSISFNAMGLWYKIDNGEWRRCKRHTIFGTLQDIVNVIDSDSNK